MRPSISQLAPHGPGPLTGRTPSGDVAAECTVGLGLCSWYCEQSAGMLPDGAVVAAVCRGLHDLAPRGPHPPPDAPPFAAAPLVCCWGPQRDALPWFSPG